MTKTADITESEVFEGSIVESDGVGIVRVAKLLGLRSKNRRNWDTPGVRRSARSLFEGARVFIDHPATPEMPRSYRDAFGVVENYQYQAGLGHFGDIRYNPDHPLAKQFVWDVKNNPKGLGMSVNARIQSGKRDRNGDVIVESLDLVRSVDIVTKPGTAEGIFESETADEPEDEIMDLKTLKEKHGDLVEQLLEDAKKNVTETAEAETLKKQLQDATEQLQALKAAEDARKDREALEADYSGLLKDSVVFADADLQKEVIECACQLATEARKSYRGLIDKISKIEPMLEEVDDDDTDVVNDDVDTDDDEVPVEEQEQPAKTAGKVYRPGRRTASRKSLYDILGIKKS